MISFKTWIKRTIPNTPFKTSMKRNDFYKIIFPSSRGKDNSTIDTDKKEWDEIENNGFSLWNRYRLITVFDSGYISKWSETFVKDNDCIFTIRFVFDQPDEIAVLFLKQQGSYITFIEFEELCNLSKTAHKLFDFLLKYELEKHPNRLRFLTGVSKITVN